MHLLHIDSGREMRGGQWQVLLLVEALAGRGYRNTLLAPEGSPLAMEASKRGVEVRPLSAVAVWKQSRLADVAHAHDARSHSIAAALSRAPVVVARRVAFDIRSGRLSRWKYSRAAHYIAVSEYVKSRLEAACIDPSRISVVYDAVPPAPARQRAEIVLAPETSDPAKGSELVRLASAAGGWTPVFSNDLTRDVQRAAVFVYISRNEGLGSGTLLAMAAGVPVVASRTGGLPEAVLDGETGLLTENEPGAIAAAVNRLLRDPALASRLGDAGRRRVEECFSVRKLAEGTEQVYRKVRR